MGRKVTAVRFSSHDEFAEGHHGPTLTLCLDDETFIMFATEIENSLLVANLLCGVIGDIGGAPGTKQVIQ